MNHYPKTNPLISAQIAAQQANEAATRALALIAADVSVDYVLGPSIQVQLDNLKLNAQVLMDNIKKIEDLR